MADYTTVGKSVKKIDALSLAMGTEPFTADFSLPGAAPLVLKFMYSDVAHADIVSLDASRAEALDGVAGVFHFWNCPDTFYTTAGQGYPEPSAYDNRLFDHKVRFVGDRICMVAAETAEIADQAIGAARKQPKADAGREVAPKVDDAPKEDAGKEPASKSAE